MIGLAQAHSDKSAVWLLCVAAHCGEEWKKKKKKTESVWDNNTWDYETGVQRETDGISVRMRSGMPVFMKGYQNCTNSSCFVCKKKKKELKKRSHPFLHIQVEALILPPWTQYAREKSRLSPLQIYCSSPRPNSDSAPRAGAGYRVLAWVGIPTLMKIARS